MPVKSGNWFQLMRKSKEIEIFKGKELIKSFGFFFENYLSGVALIKVINNNSGQTTDFEFIMVNKVFEIFSGKKTEELTGRKYSEIVQDHNIPKHSRLDIISAIATKNSKAKFNYFSESNQKWFLVTVFSPEKDYCVILLDDITKVRIQEIKFRKKEIEFEQLNTEFRNQNQELAKQNENSALLNDEHLKVIKDLRESVIQKEQIHSQLLESETTARAIIDAAADIIVLLDTNGLIIDCNKSLLHNFRQSKEQVIGKSIFVFFPPDVAESRRVSFKRVVVSGEKEVVSDTGVAGIFETIISPCFDQENRVNKIVIIARNISDRYKVQQELYESERKYRLLAENSEDVIWTFDIENMKLSYVSPTITKLLGFTVDQIMLYISDPNSYQLYKKYFQTNIKTRLEQFYQGDSSVLVQLYQDDLPCSDGTTKPVEIVSKLITDEKGKVTEILGVTRDISQRREIELKLKKALEQAEESDRLKSAFLANMSHEIRTPMNGIIGFADLLNNPNLESEKLTKYAEIININGKHLLSIINDIIDISKIESGQVVINESTIDIKTMFEELASFFSTYRYRKPDVKINLKLKLKADDSLIYGDEVKLKQILNNLISNALKFTEEGYVDFGCRLVQQDNKPYLLFIVADTGIGISKTNQTLIFERFRQVDFNSERRFGGTGLGLPISKAYVELMGGKIWVDSDVARGARFYFTIPFKKVKSSETENSLNQDSHVLTYNWHNKLILIAEDEDTNFFFLNEILNLTGAEVIQAHNGKEAIKLCKENESINLVLMDIKMPVLNGYEATRKIKEMRPELPVIAQTAFAFSDDLQKALEAGCDDYIAKPILKEYLLEKLDHFMK
jgi:PAS domain S-box-containing protein